MFYDNGLFVDFARKLAKEFGKVYYYSPWQSPMPCSGQLAPGDGFEEIERVKFPLKLADKVDLWVFPDLYHHDVQLYLEEHGARVFGARLGEEMELNRWEFKQYLKRIGLPVQPCEKVVGIASLVKHLRNCRDKYVKTSLVRGDFETFHHVRFELSENRLDELAHHLGILKEGYEFIVEDSIPDAAEVGYDGFVIDGKFPSHAMMAYEIKECGMIGVSLSYDKLAQPVKTVNAALVPAFEGYRYRGFLSTEIRYTKDHRPYLIDPCCRLGTPSNELLQELFDGWGQTLWDGATGKLSSPTPKTKFAVGAMIHCEWATDDWAVIHYPRSIDGYVKLRFHSGINDKDSVPPQKLGMGEVGMVVGCGNTMLEAIAKCKEYAAQVEGFQVHVGLESIDEAVETIKKGEKYGIKFGDQPIPSPEEIRKA